MEEQQKMDEPITPQMIEWYIQEGADGQSEINPDYFTGRESRDFYCGMIAALRVATGVTQSAHTREELVEIFTELAIQAAMLAKGKSLIIF